MNCEQAQRSIDDLDAGRLSDRHAEAVRRHLADCTDCRVLSQRAARLQRLLALKRYEQPPAGYHDNFLNEFHRRLAEATQRPSLAGRCAGWWGEVAVARWALAGAAATLVVAGLIVSVRQRSQPPVALVALRPPVVTNGSAARPALVPPPLTVAIEPRRLLAPVSLPPFAVADDERAPRYVLDRLTITPVSFSSP